MLGIWVVFIFSLCIPVILALTGFYCWRRWVSGIFVFLMKNDHSVVTKRFKTISKDRINIDGANELIPSSKDIYHKGVRRFMFFREDNPKPVPVDKFISDNPDAWKINSKELNFLFKPHLLKVFTQLKRKAELQQMTIMIFLFLILVLMIATVWRVMQIG